MCVCVGVGEMPMRGRGMETCVYVCGGGRAEGAGAMPAPECHHTQVCANVCTFRWNPLLGVACMKDPHSFVTGMLELELEHYLRDEVKSADEVMLVRAGVHLSGIQKAVGWEPYEADHWVQARVQMPSVYLKPLGTDPLVAVQLLQVTHMLFY